MECVNESDSESLSSEAEAVETAETGEVMAERVCEPLSFKVLFDLSVASHGERYF